MYKILSCLFIMIIKTCTLYIYVPQITLLFWKCFEISKVKSKRKFEWVWNKDLDIIILSTIIILYILRHYNQELEVGSCLTFKIMKQQFCKMGVSCEKLQNDDLVAFSMGNECRQRTFPVCALLDLCCWSGTKRNLRQTENDTILEKHST